ncbi:hypothetical protein MKW98_002628 [Papaver atlanticum]|uniref:Uncharacterized protein n=1 Tax=Papaver atlanticum TaxID=357466 RepID=A0AAD4SBN0_9MAGN|nr:hypothetical protein MKW98_002628 [Papaver atlanticum]
MGLVRLISDFSKVKSPSFYLKARFPVTEVKITNKENDLDCFDLRRNRNFADSIFYDVSSDLQTKKKRKGNELSVMMKR